MCAFLLCYKTPRSFHSILCHRGHLNATPPFQVAHSIAKSCFHLRPVPAEHVLCLNQNVELMLHCQQVLERGREGDNLGGAGGGGWDGECRNKWMDGVEDRPCYSYTGRSCQCDCDHGYYYRLHDEMAKVLTLSALNLTV